MHLYPTPKTMVIKCHLKEELTKKEKKENKKQGKEGTLDYMSIWKIGDHIQQDFEIGQKVLIKSQALADMSRYANETKGKKNNNAHYLIVEENEILGFWK